MPKIKPIKPMKGLPNETHTSKTKVPGGTYNGTALKNKMGSIHGAYSIDGSSSKAKSRKKTALA